MRLFVTGATGFIGSHVVKQALQRGIEVTALRRSGQSQTRIPLESVPAWITAPLDEVPAAALANQDVLLHLAAHSANVPYDTLERCIEENVVKPLRLFENAVAAGIHRYVIAGSCFEYGLSGAEYERIPVTAPLLPTQTYPASKAMSCVAFTQFTAAKSVKASYHRIFQVFGEGEAASRLWPSLRKAALEGRDFDMTLSEQIRDFVPVEDVARQLLDAAQKSEVLEPGRMDIRNLGSGQPQSIRDFALHWWRTWNAMGTIHFGKMPYRDGEVMRFVPEL